MGVGVELESVLCERETSSGRHARVRARRRRRGSDEVALFVAVHDAESGGLLATSRWVRTGVDDHELHVVRQTVLSADGSAGSVAVTLVGHEIDGRGSTATLAEEKFAGFRDAVSLGDRGTALGRGRARTAARVLLVPPFVRRVLRDDVVVLDHLVVADTDLDGPGLPEPTWTSAGETVPGLSVEGTWERTTRALRATRVHRARAEDSVYRVRLAFSR